MVGELEMWWLKLMWELGLTNLSLEQIEQYRKRKDSLRQSEDLVVFEVSGTTMTLSKSDINAGILLEEAKDILFSIYGYHVVKPEVTVKEEARRWSNTKTFCLIKSLDLKNRKVDWVEMSKKELDAFTLENPTKTFTEIGVVDKKVILMYRREVVWAIWEIERKNDA